MTPLLRRVVTAILLIVATAARGQLIHLPATADTDLIRNNTSLNVPAMVLPMNATGGLITDDAGTVAHVYWSGGALVDTQGNVWTQNGVVPQNGATPLYPSGFSGAQRLGAGPMGSALGQYYSLGTGSDVLDFAGDFSVCVIWVPNATSGSLLYDGSFGASGAGWGLDELSFYTFGAGSAIKITNLTNNDSTGSVSIVCAGRAGTTQMVMVNLGTLQTTASALKVVDTTHSAKIGNGVDNGMTGPVRRIVEVWASTTTPSAALFTSIQAHVLGMRGTRNEAIVVTRTGTSTYTTPDGNIWVSPPNILRIGCEDAAATKCGALSEGSRTNLIKQSDALDNAVWTATNVTVTPNTCTLPGNAAATMEQLVSSVNTGTVGQGTTVASGTGPFTVSGYLGATVGTQTGTIGMTFGAGNATSCTCLRSDGGTCTTGTSAGTGFTYGSITTTPVRFILMCSTTVATTVVTAFATGGQYTTSTGTICAGAMQHETSGTAGVGFATSYIPTTTVAVTRSADGVSLSNNLVGSVNNWCVDLTLVPENMSVWGSTSANFLFSVGTFGAANSYAADDSGGTTNFFVYDKAGVQKAASFVHGFTAGSLHRLEFGDSSNNTLTLSIDGSPVSPTISGTGTGIVTTQSSSLFVGNNSSGVNQFFGYIQNYTMWKKACP